MGLPIMARKKWSDIKSKAPAEVRERAAQKTRDMQRELLEKIVEVLNTDEVARREREIR